MSRYKSKDTFIFTNHLNKIIRWENFKSMFYKFLLKIQPNYTINTHTAFTTKNQ